MRAFLLFSHGQPCLGEVKGSKHQKGPLGLQDVNVGEKPRPPTPLLSDH